MNDQTDSPIDESRIAAENWERYQYGITRGHRDYTRTAEMLEGFYLGGQYDGEGRMLPGGHWNDADLAVLEEQGRPAYEFNQVLPAINAAIGYQINNRMDIAFKPRGGDATKELAETRSKVAMQIADNNKLHWRETEVFGDGMVQQRGFFECRMDFDDSIYGELKVGVLDPMDVIPDPDAKSYDPADWGDVIVTRWLTLDEIEGMYSLEARKKAEESGTGYTDNKDFGDADLDTAPRSKFGTINQGHFDAEFSTAGLTRYRIIDRQRWIRTRSDVAIFPGGDVRILTGDETPEAIAQMRQHGAILTKRNMKRVRWTVSASINVLLHDDWSPYDRFTVIPFFPYFRRGKTRGMVDNAIGPQKALDKGISQAVHIINSTANSGWQLEEGQLTNMTTAELEEIGASTGLVLERKKGTSPLEKIRPNEMPKGVANIIEMSAFTLKEVTVPDAMRGTQGPETSGVAIQSKQHAAQQSLAVPLDNLARTRNLVAGWIDYAIAKYYDTERVFQITKIDPRTGKEEIEPMVINQFDPATGMYLNDMTAGEYDIVVTELPMQVTFENSQFSQAMEMRNAGVQIPDTTVLRYSNLADKHEVIQQLESASNPPADPLAEAKARLLEAQAKKTLAEAVNKSVEGMFSATQAASNIATQPAVAPLADTLLKSAGFQDQDAAPIVPQGIGAIPGARPPASNTNPLTPANPAVGMDSGIEGGQSQLEITQ